MNDVISNSQSAFIIKGRQVIDGILMADECVDSWKKSVAPRLVCKIDLEKAFDIIDRDFLKLVLIKKCLGPKWINWMMGCVTHPWFSILLNGTSKGFFYASRGLRQGDLLSPFFFLVADSLWLFFCMLFIQIWYMAS